MPERMVVGSLGKLDFHIDPQALASAPKYVTHPAAR